LHTPQVLAIEALVVGSTVTAAAAAAGVSRATVHRWLATDAEFIAAFNRERSDHLGHVRRQLRALADEAVVTIHRAMTTDRPVPMAVRLRAAFAVLKMVGADTPEAIGSTDAREIEKGQALSDLLSSFG
jgi:AcrR family transcriptional regulator